jgi:hypothetical protein
MSDRHDIEEQLKQFRHDPGAQTKERVMSSYRRAHAVGAPFWRRPVPLYAAAAFVVVMVGVSFAAGRRVSATAGAGEVSPSVPVSIDVEWSRAECDLL